MAQPRVPGGRGEELDLPCGETKRVRSLDLGLREFDCSCGDTHAVVMDVHPPDRFLPEFLVEVLREAIETTSEDMPEFGTPHLMGIVLEEFPRQVVSADVSDDGEVGTGIIWVTDFDSRRLHEIIVELVVELMEHAVSHAEDDSAVSEFETKMLDFDVSEFVEQYRQQRDLSEDDVYA
ncbi:hypothetical protein GL213_03920 [Halogeometricum borinquense]|uniref:Uncharacterized protein n=2 Tax=Halogeometricum borinquense TaxID=60847 RepID=E4NNM9_HALBP|nr:DUF5815 family protein [Halogeometricum borinquense]ADQ66383.1 hypothetical protein Hbor_07860 [Halogeometricum borinquense DSM 11551]ELY31103.1 hypothetical protein C499_01465 [Halogeometricum borinquense DSM 11551]QIB75747.1 hypothetical protein G3I44_16550 [Halogeometricum borinquense]QIQ75744.1 hypothetical protein GL213_03920 [Halogeometricum borinquense]RYJ15215.1 hypothetical protein ELS19_15515 [Halogeometricum borinquense]